MKEGALDAEEEKGGGSEDAKLNAEECEWRSETEVLIRAESCKEMDGELLYEVGAVSNARDEGGARNPSPAKQRSRTYSAHEKRGHAKSYERELPDAHGHGDFIGLAQIQAVSYRGEAG